MYMTDLVLLRAPQWVPAEWLEGEASFRLLLEQFHLNHRRLMGQPMECRKLLFRMQSAYLNGLYPGRRLKDCASPGYAWALRHPCFEIAELTVRLDKPMKLLTRIHRRLGQMI